MKFESGDVVLAFVQFTDSNEIKARPAVVLYEEFDNIVLAGITSNRKMQGIPLAVEDGVVKPSVIKVNYIFTVSSVMIKKKLFTLSVEKKRQIHDVLVEKLGVLTA